MITDGPDGEELKYFCKIFVSFFRTKLMGGSARTNGVCNRFWMYRLCMKAALAMDKYRTYEPAARVPNMTCDDT